MLMLRDPRQRNRALLVGLRKIMFALSARENCIRREGFYPGSMQEHETEQHSQRGVEWNSADGPDDGDARFLDDEAAEAASRCSDQVAEQSCSPTKDAVEERDCKRQRSSRETFSLEEDVALVRILFEACIDRETGVAPCDAVDKSWFRWQENRLLEEVGRSSEDCASRYRNTLFEKIRHAFETIPPRCAIDFGWMLEGREMERGEDADADGQDDAQQKRGKSNIHRQTDAQWCRPRTDAEIRQAQRALRLLEHSMSEYGAHGTQLLSYNRKWNEKYAFTAYHSLQARDYIEDMTPYRIQRAHWKGTQILDGACLLDMLQSLRTKLDEWGIPPYEDDGGMDAKPENSNDKNEEEEKVFSCSSAAAKHDKAKAAAGTDLMESGDATLLGEAKTHFFVPVAEQPLRAANAIIDIAIDLFGRDGTHIPDTWQLNLANSDMSLGRRFLRDNFKVNAQRQLDPDTDYATLGSISDALKEILHGQILQGAEEIHGDIGMLLEMGFDTNRAAAAFKKCGNLDDALAELLVEQGGEE